MSTNELSFPDLPSPFRRKPVVALPSLRKACFTAVLALIGWLALYGLIDLVGKGLTLAGG